MSFGGGPHENDGVDDGNGEIAVVHRKRDEWVVAARGTIKIPKKPKCWLASVARKCLSRWGHSCTHFSRQCRCWRLACPSPGALRPDRLTQMSCRSIQQAISAPDVAGSTSYPRLSVRARFKARRQRRRSSRALDKRQWTQASSWRTGPRARNPTSRNGRRSSGRDPRTRLVARAFRR